MNTEIYRFEVGTFECIAVSDGTFAYPGDPVTWLFANAPKGHLEQVLRKHKLQPEQWVQWVSTYTCLVINTGRHQVLVDTGEGMTPTTGKLIPNLQAEGIAPEDIDTVILTRGHPDQIGGNTDSEGKLAFPNARHVMWKDEWDFWTSAPSLAELKVDEHPKQILLTFVRNNLPSIQGQLYLVDHETEIVPGIHAVAAPGHTPGHMAAAISSGSEQLLYISDAALHPIHLEQPDWYGVVEFAPDQVLTTRRQLFKRVAAENALVLAFHFPFPGQGHVIQKGKEWQWQPIETTG